MIKNNASCLDCPNENCFIKKHCSEPILREMDSNKIVNRYTKKQFIFHEGNTTDGIYFVLSGKIKLFKTGGANKNQMINIAKNGDFLGHRSFATSKAYPVSAEAITASNTCFISKQFFYKILEETPKMALDIMLFLADELNYKESRLRDMANFSVREKVAKMLITLIDKFGLNEQSEIIDIENISRQDMAELAGLNSNQVTKLLANFRDENIIQINNKKIKIININALEKVIPF